MNRILLIARNYPPMKGGMGKYSQDLYESISKDVEIDLLKNKGGSKNIYFYFKVIFFLFKEHEKYKHIHFCDGVLAPIGFFLKKIKKTRVSITIHALDIVYDSWIYQLIIPKCVNSFDFVICVSHYTMNECIKRGVDKRRCQFIPNGIVYEENERLLLDFESVEKQISIAIKNKKILFSVCRLIKRKGLVWFIVNIFKNLPEDYAYIIAGVGPETNNISNVIKENKLEKRVIMLGEIDELFKNSLFKYSSFFVMPNIKVEGDAEGFGISVIEAASFGLPCIASNIEGITDAVINNKTGLLLEAGNVDAYIDAFAKSIFDKEVVRNVSKSHFDWAILKESYLNMFE